MTEGGKIFLTASLRMEKEAAQGILSWVPGTADFTLTGKTDIGRIYAESTARFDGVSRADGLYIFALPSGCTAGNPVLSVKAEDDTLSLSYIEILIGDLPDDEASKGVRK